MGNIIKFSSLDEAMQAVEQYTQHNITPPPGGWSLYKTLCHAAQSIEFSMAQYPEHKSALFKNTVGRIALSVFIKRGYMKHDITMPIPSAPPLQPEGTATDGFQRLQKAVNDFQNFQGQLAPHFAYGTLTKAQYDKVQAMHIANHLSSFAR